MKKEINIDSLAYSDIDKEHSYFMNDSSTRIDNTRVEFD